jgi:hypothetical protein
MKDTEVDAMLAPAGTAVEEGGGWKFATLASSGKRLLASKVLPTRYCPRSTHSTTRRSGEYARPLARNASYGLPAGGQRKGTPKLSGKDRGYGFSNEEVEDGLPGLAQELLPNSLAPKRDEDWAHELCKGTFRAWRSTKAGCPEPRKKSWTPPANTAGMSGCTTLAFRTRPGRLSSGAQRPGALGTRGNGVGAS